MKRSFLSREIDTRFLSPLAWICCCVLFSGVISIPIGAGLYQLSQHVIDLWCNVEPADFIGSATISGAGSTFICTIIYLLIFRRLPSTVERIVRISRIIFLCLIFSSLAGAVVISLIGIINTYFAVYHFNIYDLQNCLRFVIFGSEFGTYLGVVVCTIYLLFLRKKNTELTQ